jgi:serine/threonine-protein kinase
MANKRAGRLAEIVKSAIERQPENWTAFLDEECGSDLALRVEAEALLEQQEGASRFMEEPALHFAAKMFLSDGAYAAGQLIGDYEILSLIAAGGMGEVYLAHDRKLHRTVALKLIRRGMSSEQIVRHFKREERLLAGLNHPNIAQLYGGGVTADGVPFFAMEYVEGQRLDEHCDEHKLSTDERLQLFCKVCSAVTYAHQHLVIHRDIKPANIRVSAEGEPKLLDFGIAKLLEPTTSSGVEHTLTFATAMTPEYASPEQVRGEAVATTSDVYSLGVVLYRLLTGQSPYRTKTNRPEEIARAITDQEPTPPSTVVVRGQETEVGSQKLLRGDLDNIVLRAIRKEPQHRYESAAQFSEDIRRHLAGLPVIARKGTWSYRSAKFIQRNRMAVCAGALVFLALLGGVIATGWEARATRQEKARAESINGFLEQMLNYSNPQLALAGDGSRPTTVTEAMDEAAKRLESGAFADQPEVRADLERIISTSYAGQGKRQLADEHIQKHVALVARLYGKDHPRTLAAIAIRARILFSDGKMVESEKLYRQILPGQRAEQQKGNIKAEVLADELNNFAYLRRTQGDSHEAELLFRESLLLGPQFPKEERYLTEVTRSTLASTLADQGKFEEAVRMAQEEVAGARQAGRADTPAFGFSLTVLGSLLTDGRHFVEAEAVLREAEVIFHKRLSPRSLWLADNLRNEAALLYEQDRLAESLEKATNTLDLYRQNFGIHYDNYPTALIIKGLILSKTGKAQEGEVILREAVRLRNNSMPKGHFWVALANDALGECLTIQGRYDQAEPLLLQSYESLKSSQGTHNPRTRLALQRLVALYEDWGKFETAKTYRNNLAEEKF